MRDFVKGFGKIKQDGIYLCLGYSCYSFMDCLDELGLIAGREFREIAHLVTSFCNLAWC